MTKEGTEPKNSRLRQHQVFAIASPHPFLSANVHLLRTQRLLLITFLLTIEEAICDTASSSLLWLNLTLTAHAWKPRPSCRAKAAESDWVSQGQSSPVEIRPGSQRPPTIILTRSVNIP
jgi:hypothetical protein